MELLERRCGEREEPQGGGVREKGGATEELGMKRLS